MILTHLQSSLPPKIVLRNFLLTFHDRLILSYSISIGVGQQSLCPQEKLIWVQNSVAQLPLVEPSG